MALVRALHGRRPRLDLSSMGGGHGGLPEKEGGGRVWLLGVLGWGAWGGTATGGRGSVPTCAVALCSCFSVRGW
jgi:hypothetical protein